MHIIVFFFTANGVDEEFKYISYVRSTTEQLDIAVRTVSFFLLKLKRTIKTYYSLFKTRYSLGVCHG